MVCTSDHTRQLLAQSWSLLTSFVRDHPVCTRVLPVLGYYKDTTIDEDSFCPRWSHDFPAESRGIAANKVRMRDES